MAYKIHNKEKLQTALEQMTGKDFAKAEKEARLHGAADVDIATSRVFFAVLASYAYKVPYPEIEALPIKEYIVITGEVGSFLLGQAEDLATPSGSQEK